MRNLGKEELIVYLLNYAFKHGLSYILVRGEPYDPALSFKHKHKMIINTNWHTSNELPFIIGHEIGHLMLGDSGIAYWPSFSGQNFLLRLFTTIPAKMVTTFKNQEPLCRTMASPKE
ncbi:M48 family metalloprotease [Lactobacillus kitasatonis]|uniref:M48 family metalloprotease n=1 Tax=Lactobacillus kitasatonis TaxID=237446 RepID=UPI0026F18838|nr:M48 family metalloprotease [Lactobacillus kitasatonis]